MPERARPDLASAMFPNLRREPKPARRRLSVKWRSSARPTTGRSSTAKSMSAPRRGVKRANKLTT